MTGELIRDSKYDRPYEQTRQRIMERLLPKGPGCAVDLGCGSGHYARLLTDRGWHVIGIDAEPSNCDLARRHAERVICADVIAGLNELPARSVDLIAALEIIEHLDDREGFLCAIDRVSRSFATMILSTPNRWSPEGLYGHYWLEKVRGAGKWRGWDTTHRHIYSSWELLGCLRRHHWRPRTVVGYYYQSRFSHSVPLTSSSFWPLNRIGFKTIVVGEYFA